MVEIDMKGECLDKSSIKHIKNEFENIGKTNGVIWVTSPEVLFGLTDAQYEVRIKLENRDYQVEDLPKKLLPDSIFGVFVQNCWVMKPSVLRLMSLDFGTTYLLVKNIGSLYNLKDSRKL